MRRTGRKDYKFEASGGSAGQATLTWEDTSKDEAGFTLQRSSSPSFDTIEKFVTLPADATSYTDKTFVSGENYYYRIWSYNRGGDSPASVTTSNVSDPLPAWLAPDSEATWNAGTRTLTVFGAASVIGELPSEASLLASIIIDGPSARLTIQTVAAGAGNAVSVGGLHLINGAKTILASLGDTRTAVNYRVLVVGGGGLSIDATSKLDLTDNDLILNYTGPSPIANVEAMVRAGYNGGNWQGNGITSSIVADPSANGRYVLGISDNAERTAATQFSTFDGQSVDDTTIFVKFTYRADINLDGVVNVNDSFLFNGNYNEAAPLAEWATGDQNYDGKHDINDSFLFNGSYNESLNNLGRSPLEHDHWIIPHVHYANAFGGGGEPCNAEFR